MIRASVRIGIFGELTFSPFSPLSPLVPTLPVSPLKRQIQYLILHAGKQWMYTFVCVCVTVCVCVCL